MYLIGPAGSMASIGSPSSRMPQLNAQTGAIGSDAEETWKGRIPEALNPQEYGSFCKLGVLVVAVPKRPYIWGPY